jgi:hypothetical protein
MKVKIRATRIDLLDKIKALQIENEQLRRDNLELVRLLEKEKRNRTKAV